MAFPGRTDLQKVYFHHIPKTAGTALRNHLIRHFGPARVAPMLRAGSLRDALAEYCRFDAITGHLAAVPGDSLPADRICVTMLRDPVDRTISQFFFSRTVHSSGVRDRRNVSESFDDWVLNMSESGANSLNAHVEALWALGWNNQDRPALVDRVHAAQDALARFDIVALQERLHESIAILAYCMRWRAPDSLPVDNPTPDRPAVSDLAPRTQRRLRELLAPDIDLYEHARQRFEQRRLSVLIDAAASRSGTPSFVGSSNAAVDLHAERRDDRVANPGSHGDTGEIVVETVSIHGEISGSHFVQTGEWVTIKIDLRSLIDEPNLTAGFAIRDHAGILIFGTNTLQLGHTISVSPGRYSVSFRFPNDLGRGCYSVTLALHRDDSHLKGSFYWKESASAFEVVDSVVEEFEGRVRLHVETLVTSLDDTSHLVVCDSDRLSGAVLTIGHRNAAIRDFRARVTALDAIESIAAGADAVLRLAIRNCGDECWGAFGRRPVHVAHYWTSDDGAILMQDGLRTAFPRDVSPGQEVQMSCFVRAPDVAGECRLVWTLVQEEVAWFDERNADSRLTQAVRVVR